MTNKEIKTKLNAVINNNGKCDKEVISHIAGYVDKDDSIAVNAEGDVKNILFYVGTQKYTDMLEACINIALSNKQKLAMFCEAVRQANEWAKSQR